MSWFRKKEKVIATREERPYLPMRKMLSMRSFYAGAIDRLTASFKGTALSNDESLKRDLDIMRHRARELVNDNDYAKKYISMVKTNVIGSKGIRLQCRAKDSRGLPDKLDNDAVESSWNDFCKVGNCTANGASSMIDLDGVAIGTVATDGEVLIRVIKGHAFKYGMSLQLVDVDRLDTNLNKENVNGGNRIVMSIEVDPFEKVVAYYVMVKHPSETTVSYSNRHYLRLPAKEVIHLFKSERVAQKRGFPWMAASMRRLNMIGGYEEAELVSARVGASKGGFYYTETGEEYKGDGVNEDGSVVQSLEPGTFEQLPDNVKFQMYDPQHPSGSYNYFLRGVLKGAAAGLGVSYTSLTGDLEAVNYSSIRAGLIDERENWRVLQGWFIEHAKARIYEEWLGMALTRGLIINAAGVTLPLSKKQKYLDVKWQARGWAWVDPLKDQQANELAVASGHMTNSMVVAAQGNDLEEIYETLQYEKQLQESYGLEFEKSSGDSNNVQKDETVNKKN